MTESHEAPRDQQADTGGRSAPASNPESPRSQETPDPRTAIEQRTPVTSAVLSARSPEREALASILSQVYEDPAEVNAVIEEIGAGSTELVQISIRMLELMLSTKLEAQGDRLDTQHEEIRALCARLDALGTALVSLGAKIDRQTEKLDAHNKALASQSREIRALVEKLDALGAEVMALGAKVDGQTEKLDPHSRALASQSREIRALAEKLDALGAEVRALDAKLDALQSDIRSFRREMRLVLAVLTLLVAIGLFGSFGQGCSRPVESHVGVEASQTVAEPSADPSSVPVVTRDPSGESVETDETAQADQAPEVDGEGLVADPEARR